LGGEGLRRRRTSEWGVKEIQGGPAALDVLEEEKMEKRGCEEQNERGGEGWENTVIDGPLKLDRSSPFQFNIPQPAQFHLPSYTQPLSLPLADRSPSGKPSI